MDQTEIRSALALFLFRGDDVFKKVSVLSGGERAKISLFQVKRQKLICILWTMKSSDGH